MSDLHKHRSTARCRKHGVILSFAIVMLLPCIASCSGSDPDGGNSDGETINPACRRFATRYTEHIGSSEQRWTCAFDRSLLELTCRLDVAGVQERRTRWDTLSAAAADNRPFGKRTRRLETFIGECTAANEHTYDASGRLAATTMTITGDPECSGSNVVYDAWDGVGRPTHGVQNSVGGSECMGQDFSISYDETTRTVTYASSGGSGPDCFTDAESVTFDEDGNFIAWTVGSVVITYAIEARGQICPE